MNIKELLEFDITKEFNFSDEKEKERFLIELGEIFYANLMERLLPLLAEEKQEDLNNLLDNEDTDHNSVMSFFAESVPTFPEILGDEMIRTKEEMLLVLDNTK